MASPARPFITWQFTRRYNGTLNAPGAGSKRIINRDRGRVGLVMTNRGTGDVVLSHEASALALGEGWTIGPGETFNMSQMPFAPQNELHATGAAGHDLFISEWIDTRFDR